MNAVDGLLRIYGPARLAAMVVYVDVTNGSARNDDGSGRGTLLPGVVAGGEHEMGAPCRATFVDAPSP